MFEPRSSVTTLGRGFASKLAILLLLWSGFALPSYPQSPDSSSREQKLKADLLEISTGSVVELRLKDKSKIRGKLDRLTDSDVQVQFLQSGKIETRAIELDQIRSVKVQGKGMSTAAKITLGALAGIGAFVVIIIAVAAAHGFDS